MPKEFDCIGVVLQTACALASAPPGVLHVKVSALSVLLQALGCGLSGWNRAVHKIQSDRKQLSKSNAAYRAEVAQTYAQSILPQLLINNGWLHSHR